MDSKKCSDCGLLKDITKYNKSGSKGYRSECKQCTSKRRLKGRVYEVQKLPPEKPFVPPVVSNPNEICFMGDQTMDDIEREAILRTLKFYKGSRTKTATHLRLAIRTVTNKIQEYREQGYEIPEPKTSELIERLNKDKSIF